MIRQVYKPSKREGGKRVFYRYSTWIDSVLTALLLLPLAARYHGHWLTIFYDRTGERYGKGKRLRIFADGKEIAASEKLERVTGHLKSL